MSRPPFAHNIEKREAFRQELFKRQAGLCHLCGKPMQLERKKLSKVGRLFATFDHVIPRSKGGTAYHTNLKLAHNMCNSGRNDREVVEATSEKVRRKLTSSLSAQLHQPQDVKP